MMRMTQSFAAFAKLPAPSPRPLELRALLEEVVGLYGNHPGVGVRLKPGEPVRVEGDPDQLRRAFGNLIKNALEASGAAEKPVEVELSAGALAKVTVRDHGTGIEAPLLGSQLIRSIGSTKAGGSGLGLPIAQKILHDHGGGLTLTPAEKGTVAAVELPVLERTA